MVVAAYDTNVDMKKLTSVAEGEWCDVGAEVQERIAPLR